jgi:hypothetical protein
MGNKKNSGASSSKKVIEVDENQPKTIFQTSAYVELDG